MGKPGIKPFKNESDTLQIENLTIENRLDRISLYGDLDITLDKDGLKTLKELKAVLDLALIEMEKSELPDKIAIPEPERVKNPFA